MNIDKKHCPRLRVLALICSTQDADEANQILIDEQLPVFFQLRALGTASSEMMDLLGLGNTSKTLSLSIMQRELANKILERLGTELGLGLPGTGIAFTIPITGVSTLTMKVVDEYARRELFEKMEHEARQAAAASKSSLITAIVNQGFSEDVMEAARQFGARGGTVVHARQVGGEAILNFLGVPIQEEKEMILIISSSEMKGPIMKAISETCGLRSEAQGLVMSSPIDSLIGLSSDD